VEDVSDDHPLGPKPPQWFKIVYVDLRDGGEPVEVAKLWTPPL
jgi:hypothetical protein